MLKARELELRYVYCGVLYFGKAKLRSSINLSFGSGKTEFTREFRQGEKDSPEALSEQLLKPLEGA